MDRLREMREREREREKNRDLLGVLALTIIESEKFHSFLSAS